MPRIIDIPYVGTPTQNTSVIVTKELVTGRIRFEELAYWTGVYLNLDQAVSTSSNVTFKGLFVNRLSLNFLQVYKGISIGGYPSNIGTEGFDSSALVLSNNFFNTVTNQYELGSSTLRIINFKNNNDILNENFPLISTMAVGGSADDKKELSSGDKLFAIQVHGRGTVSHISTNTGELSFSAGQNFRQELNETDRAGTTFKIATQPNSIVLGQNTKFTHIRNTWSTGTDFIMRNNLFIGDGGEGGAPELFSDQGIQQVGHGATNLFIHNSNVRILGVPDQSTIVDNPSLRGTNRLTFITSRRNTQPGRRDAILRGDSIGIIDFRASNVPSSNTIGVLGGSITFGALENFTTATQGTGVSIATVNSATNTTSNRFLLSNLIHAYNSENHLFLNNTGTILASLSTSGFVVNVPFSAVDGLLSRTSVVSSATTLAPGVGATLELQGYKTYVLSKITTNYPSRVRIYSDSNSRALDLARTEGTTSTAYSGLIAEVITTSGSLTKLITPGIIGFNSETIATTTVYVSLTNKDVLSRNFVVTLDLLKLEK